MWGPLKAHSSSFSAGCTTVAFRGLNEFKSQHSPINAFRPHLLGRRTRRRCATSDGTSELSTQVTREEAPESQLAPATENSTTKRPEWLPHWFPEWLTKKQHPLVQLFIMLVLYAFHIFYLSKTTWNFPCQLIPNDSGAFQSIGMNRDALLEYRSP